MNHSFSVHGICHGLFTRYPSAVRLASPDSSLRSMVLMVRKRDDAKFFVLSRHQDGEAAHYSLSPWPTGAAVPIQTDGAPVPHIITDAVIRGIPLPRHGSMFGWGRSDSITAMVVCYTDYEPTRPLPRWSVMPLAGTAERQWPPFTRQRFFGRWFWEYLRAGDLVPLDRLIAETPDTVFWAETWADLGSDCCVVARDITWPDGRRLRCGCYVYSELLRQATVIPSLPTLLAEADKTDLAPQFSRLTHCDDGPWNGSHDTESCLR